ncbi:glycoside hydrolase N-terminal domain-containing protein [Aliiglaciecola sp. 2_MG-2023]|uniref:glycosyl hydrolase family 95 catalytic domain-containing protein n=1 Tax=unclassified Aliiglaciecola TaxID=2593648 RepID=UPI0026E46ED1|nr:MULTISPECIES: glycoside hydrolase N-terminal domain-containing protein [unclassified Aliiglaciecola]MDO6709297.1 glycoside hydrolase N-terminal domain-containing protein [Aliiglaciecola sp. 2_MG-2023]MDO6750445.1 glycoside hydrolase N-terminal domain-containing protein [Aliiglaciecola sp. 1_MG-2023]
MIFKRAFYTAKLMLLSLSGLLLVVGCSGEPSTMQSPTIERKESTLTTAYKHGITMVTPAFNWREGLPAGNGTIAATVYGAIAEERVLFNHNELWYGGKISPLPDVSDELPVVRQLMLDKKYLEANYHYTNKLREKGLDSANAKYHPAFDLLVTTNAERMFADYARTLNFETGEIEVKWRDGDISMSRRLIVSIPDQISLMSIKANKAKSITGEVTLDIHDLRDAIAQKGGNFDPGFRYKSHADGEFISFSSTGSDRGEFGGVVRVVVDGSNAQALNIIPSAKRKLDGYVGQTEGKISYQNADEVTLYIAVFANEDSSTAIARLKSELAEIDEGYDAYFARHSALQSQRFNSINVNINPNGSNNTPNEVLLLNAYQGDVSKELKQKMFEYGRYLLISSSTAGGYPANLQGIWNGYYSPPWRSLYGINENLQMTYWQGLPGNMKESMMAFYDYFDSHIDEFRENARKLWGTRGIYIPPFMSPDSGVLRHTAPHVVNWTDAAGWLAAFYYDYYLFTGDENFLRNRAVPFMKEVALFYEDFIVKGPDGKNMIFPSQSPENEPAEMHITDAQTGRVHKVKVQINSTIAFAISKEVLRNLIAASELLDIEQAGVKRWKALLADMPNYAVNEDGALREWMHPDFKDNYEHRHQSHIYPLFPGQEITAESEPELFQASKVAIEKRLRIGLKSQTGWSLAHMANVYARLDDGEKAQEALDILTRCCLGQNLFTYHNDWRNMGATLPLIWGPTAPFQMDANFGYSAAVTEMLVGSTQSILRILPAIPGDWDEGSFSDILTRLGIKVSAKWSEQAKQIELSLVATRESHFDMKFPSPIKQITASEEHILGPSEFGENYTKVSLSAGQSATFQVSLKLAASDVNK